MRVKKTILGVLATFIVCTAWAQAPREELIGASYCDPVTLLWRPLGYSKDFKGLCPGGSVGLTCYLVEMVYADGTRTQPSPRCVATQAPQVRGPNPSAAPSSEIRFQRTN